MIVRFAFYFINVLILLLLKIKDKNDTVDFVMAYEVRNFDDSLFSFTQYKNSTADYSD